MGATPNLGLPWPELPTQADGPAAFQALATATENKMTTFITRSSWNGDIGVAAPPGAQVALFNQDTAAAAIGWCWIDVQVNITVGDPAVGGGIPNVGGMLIISGQNLSQELRRFRWHSNHRSWIFSVGGGCAMALPASVSVINIQVTMAVDSGSASTGAQGVQYNVGLTQFGAARG